jgi:hypothetical protein
LKWGGVNTLISYHYKLILPYFEKLWNEQVRIHLAGQGPFTVDAKKQEKTESFLCTYAYPREIMEHNSLWEDCRPRVIIDSGAFTAFTSGKVIDPRDYVKWALEFQSRWEHKMKSLVFMNLDVIGDDEKSDQNLKLIEAMGLKVIPIFTYQADIKYLRKYIQEYDYIALGGLVGKKDADLKAWLDYCFSQVMNYKKQTGILRKIHLLGVTKNWVLLRYPCFSSDSSTWVDCLRFGKGQSAGIKKIPRYGESEDALTTTIHVLKKSIQKYKKMETDATNLWKSRGIIFDD